LWEFEAHFARLGHQALHLRAQVLVFLNQQLLALQHWGEALRELAFKNVGEVFQQAFQLLELGSGLIPLQFQARGAGLIL
tara:strand:- start:2413 stop:2652 length:240 start_codon:yes stop_codon:yes gene_type:complete